MAALPRSISRRLLTAEEAANYCGVSVSTLKAHIRVAPVKIGHCVRYDVLELDAYLDHLRNAPPMTVEEILGQLDEGRGEGRKALS